MTDNGRPAVTSLLDQLLLRYHVDDLIDAINEVHLGTGGAESVGEQIADIDEQIERIRSCLVDLEDRLDRIESKLDAAINGPRWVIEIGRHGITAARGNTQQHRPG